VNSVTVPNHVVETGGIVPVLIKGQCLNHAATVHFGAKSVSAGTSVKGSFKIESQGAILATPPAEAAGTVNIQVTSPSAPTGPGGTSAVKAGATYTYYAPKIAHITPASGPIAGGTVVIVKGAALSEPGLTPTVKFGATPATSVTVTSEGALKVVAPAHNAATVALSVATTGGTGSFSYKYLYEVK
jgi:hypothetical protein